MSLLKSSSPNSYTGVLAMSFVVAAAVSVGLTTMGSSMRAQGVPESIDRWWNFFSTQNAAPTPPTTPTGPTMTGDDDERPARPVRPAPPMRPDGMRAPPAMMNGDDTMRDPSPVMMNGGDIGMPEQRFRGGMQAAPSAPDIMPWEDEGPLMQDDETCESSRGLADVREKLEQALAAVNHAMEAQCSDSHPAALGPDSNVPCASRTIDCQASPTGYGCPSGQSCKEGGSGPCYCGNN